MTKRILQRVLTSVLVLLLVLLAAGQVAWAQPPMGPPGSGGSGDMPWQVAAMFTANWVLAAAGVAILSRPAKRPEKPKKALLDDEE